jgi:hypothetical protein
MEQWNRVKYFLLTFVLLSSLFPPSPSFAQNPSPTPATVETPQENPILENLASFASTVITLNNPARLESPRQGFGPGEQPEFELDIPIETSEKIGEVTKTQWKTDQEDISVVIREKETGATVSASIKKNDAGAFAILAEKGPDWVPGNYSLQISARESFVYTRDLTQDFSWGVLALNSNKSAYLPGETAQLSFGILDELGHTLCDAPLSLRVIPPEGGEQVFSRDNGKIRQSGECAGDSVTEKPDYLAELALPETGTYQLILTGTNENGEHTISDYFTVEDNLPYEIERTKFPTRVYPMAPYEVELTVKANQDYRGPVRDFVPKAFLIEDISGNGNVAPSTTKTGTPSAEIAAQDAESYQNLPELSKLMYAHLATGEATLDHTPKPITWEVDWKQGETYTLSYTIHFPTISPEFFLIGPFTVGEPGTEPEFRERRQWQVANDAARTWDGGGTGNGWDENANWSSNLEPGSGDTATFNTTSTKNCDIDKSITIQTLTIASGYTGTITQTSTFTITLNTGSFSIADGTFAGGSGDITLSASGADFSQTGGTFTNTSGTMFVSDNFTVSGGTYNHGSGTVNWTDNGDDAYTINANNVTFYNFSTTGTCAGTITFTNGNTNTFSNAINFGNSCGSSTLGPAFAGTATLNVTGNINVTQTGNSGGGAAVFLVNGTGAQTVDGETDDDNSLPDMTFNKSSGTLTFTDRIVFDDNVTFTAASGGFTTTGAKTIFNATDDNATITLTGTWNFNDVEFNEGCNTHNISTGTLVANGTLTFNNPGCSGNEYLESVSGGAVHAKGDIVTIGYGTRGDLQIVVNGTGTQTITGETDDDTLLPGINVNKTSGTLNLVDRIVGDDGDWTLTAGTVNPGTSSVGSYGNMTYSGNWTFYDFHLAEGGCNAQRDIPTGTTITVNGTLYIDPGASCGFVTIGASSDPGGEIHAKGDILVSEEGMYSNNGRATIVANGTGSQTLDGTTGDTTAIPNFEIDKPSGTLTITDRLTTSNNWTYTQGTVNASGSTIIPRHGSYFEGTHTLGNVDFCGGTWSYMGIEANTVLTASGNVRFQPTALGCAGTGTGREIYDGTLAIQGNLTVETDGLGGDARIQFTGTGTQTVTIGSGDEFPTGAITINKPSGTVNLAQNTTFNASGQDLTVTSGTLNLANYNLTVNDAFTVATAGTVILTGDQTLTTAATSVNGSVEYTGTNTYTSLKLGNTYRNLTISGSGTYSPSGTLTVSGTFTQSTGTFNMPSNFALSGSLVKTGGTFNAGSNTLTISDSSQTTAIDGNWTFYNLTAITPDKVITLGANDTFTVTNTLTMRGTTADPLILQSDTPSTQANFVVSSLNPSVQGVRATDIDSCGGNTITALNSASGGNVDCWQFSAQNWYDTSWPQRTRIRIFKEKVTDGPHTDFPVLVQTTSDSGLAAYAQDDGDDIVFTSDDAITPLDYELVSFNGTTGAMVAWVKVPTLSSAQDTILWMYYGNSAVAAQEDPTNVWTNNYHAVWHMEEAPTAGNNEIQDSTSNNRDGSAESGLDSSNLVTGVLGNGLDFEASSNQLVRVPNGAGLNNVSTGTISTWVRWNASGQNSVYPGNKYGAIMAREQNGVFGNNIIAIDNSNPASGKLTWTHQDANNKDITGDTNVGTSTWRYVVVSFTSGNHVMYMDGVQVGTSTITGANNNNSAIDFTFGGWEGQGTPDITLDELRLAGTTRSAGWVATEYRNMSDANFLSVDGTTQAIPRVNIQGGVRIQGGSKLKN